MITQKELKYILDYDKDTGLFYWRNSFSNRIKIGDIAGSLNINGYINIKINSKMYKAHRLAWFYTYGHFPKLEIDHINRIRNDNRIKNLRDVSHSINVKNIELRKDNSSGYSGVRWYESLNKWRAKITINKKQLHLGYFKDLKGAIKARKMAEIKYGYLTN